MIAIELADFLLIAELHTGKPAEELARMPRVASLGAAAIAAPLSGFGDHEVFPTFVAKAAAYCMRIIAYHPLPDGNKRVGYSVMVEFVERNGRRFEHPNDDWHETAQMIETLAAGEVSEDVFSAWVAERIRAH